jgi:hypothetical protein
VSAAVAKRSGKWVEKKSPPKGATIKSNATPARRRKRR